MLRFFVCFVSVFVWFSSLAAAETRIALVIGNSSYQHTSPLDNPANDADLMEKTLKAVGFQVTKVVDATRFEMRQAMLTYSRSLAQPNTVGVFYYAGHGMQVEGQNYLLPIDAAPARKDELSLHGVSINDFLRTLDSVSGKQGRLNVVILDACRNNPFARGWRAVSRGLATVDAPSGTLIAFATAPGDVASDGTGKNSPYTSALAKMITKPGLAIEQTFKGARNLVWEWTSKSGSPQIPWESTSLRGDFYFVPQGKGPIGDKKELKPSADRAKKIDPPNDHATLERDADKKKALEACRVLPSGATRPFSIYEGSTFCSKDKANKALIKTIRKRAIIFSVNGERNVVCTVKDLCQFNWPGAPLFRVSIKSAKGAHQNYQGQLLPQ